MEKNKVLRQVLSNESVNDQNYVVLNDTIDWKRYKKNPVLLSEHFWGAVIGNVSNIKRDKGDWIGELIFDRATELSREKEAQYYAGSIRGVSLAGKIYYKEKDGVKFTTRFEVYEISLVTLPSNADAVAEREDDIPVLAVSFHATEEEEIAEFSANENILITNYLQKMEEEKKTEDLTEGNTLQSEGTAQFSAESSAEKKAEDKEPSKSKLGRFASAIADFACKLASSEEDEEKKEDDKKVEEEEEKRKSDKEEDKQADKEADDADFSAEIPDPQKETEARMYNPENKNKKDIKFSSKMERTTIHQYLGSVEGKDKFSEIARFSANPNATKEAMQDSRKDMLLEFTHVLKNDKHFQAFASSLNFSVDNEPYSASTVMGAIDNVAQFASGLNSMSFITTNPDLAKMEWSTLIYRLLFPEDSFASRCQMVAGEDKAGVIWTNSAINAKVYYGKRAPLNVAGTTYDDTPLGIIMNLFALQNIIWQQANTDLLAYDDVSLGTSEALRTLKYKVHNYYLQQIAEAASVKVPTTGASYASANQFPANASAAGNIKAITLADILSLQAQFVNQNYTLDKYSVEAVTPAVMMNQLQQLDPTINLLYGKISGDVTPMTSQLHAFNFTNRAVTSLYDTAQSQVVDPELYLDGKISNDGTIPTYTPPVLPATAYGTLLAFVPEDVVIGVGRTNVHMVVDPSNYGWRMSIDYRTGAGAGRAGGKGIGLIYPAVNA